MKKKDEGKNPGLRKRAEKIVRKKLKGIIDIPEKNILELFYELEVHQIELEMQNEELRRVQQELEESRNRYFELYDLAPVGYVTLENGIIIEINLTGAGMLGIERRLLIKKRFSSFIAPDYQDEYYLFNQRILENETKQTCELKLLKKDGTLFYANLEGIAVENSKGSRQVRATFTDIAKRKQTEEQVKRSLEDKELLLKEIHHRVKNNMQVITSILALQSASTGDEKIASVFAKCQRRIESMALIHEKLYQTEDLSHINFKEYITSLTETLLHSYKKEEQEISLKIDVRDIFLDIDTAVPVGLILNELIANSLKHSFKEKNEGEIRISFREIDEERLEFKVGDSSDGLPSDFDIRSTGSLGFQLVRLLAEKRLKGKVEFHQNRGAEFTITFKRVKP